MVKKINVSEEKPNAVAGCKMAENERMFYFAIAKKSNKEGQPERCVGLMGCAGKNCKFFHEHIFESRLSKIRNEKRKIKQIKAL